MAKRVRVAKQHTAELGAAGPPPYVVRNAYWLLPFLLFLVIRLFCGDPYFRLGGDQCTFLELGRTFPKHQLYDHELYLIHSPLFGYAIGLLQLVMPLFTAGLVASLLFACGAFFALRNLALFDNLPPAAISAGLIYLAISRPADAYDYQVARVSILVCATAFALLAFLHWLREPSSRKLKIVILANVLCLLVSDQALLLLPCEAVLFWARGSRREWKGLLGLAAASAAAAAVWPAVRLTEFLTRAHLPAGIDGTIEFTKGLSLKAVIQPNFLPFTNLHRSLFIGTSLSFADLKPALFASLPTDLLMVPTILGAALLLVLIVAALARPEYRKRAMVWLALSVIFLLPVGLGMYEWYGMAFVIPFALLLMDGVAACMAYWKGSEKWWAIGLAGVSVAAGAMWLTAPPPPDHSFLFPRGGTHFLFARPPLTRASAVSQFFSKLPRDTGIMAPVGLVPEVVYLTDKRVVALPFDPALLDRFTREYQIRYLLASSEYLHRYEQPVADQYTGALIARYLVQHPDRYRMVYAVRENNPAFYEATDYWVFEVGKAE